MDIKLHSLNETYLKSFEELYIQIFGDFDNPVEHSNFRRYIMFNSHLVKIAVQFSKIIGYIIGDQNSSHKARIFSLYVLPSFQRRQIGSDLIQLLEKEFLTRQPNLRYLSVRIPEKFFNTKDFFIKHRFHIITKINCYEKSDLFFPYQPNPNVKIKSATKNDLRALVKLEKICFSDYWRKTREEFREEIESKTNSLFIALLNDKLIGYNSNSISANGIEGHYARIATLPEYRKQHIATSLTVKAFQWFKKQQVQKVLLTTFAKSNFHNEMYKRWGFKFTEQELIMAKHYI
ncbi:MAG: GNAT family N-acetyltransferase [Promethearchaeota archaeon]